MKAIAVLPGKPDSENPRYHDNSFARRVIGWGSEIRGEFQIIQVKTLIANVH